MEAIEVFESLLASLNSETAATCPALPAEGNKEGERRGTERIG